MNVNITCVVGNSIVPCPSPGSPAGLAVGLTLFFLLLLIAAAAILYKYSGKVRTMVQCGERESDKVKEDCQEPRCADQHQYTSLMKEEPAAQTPIYENLNTLTSGHNGPATKSRRKPAEAEENVYLQCDSADGGIYSNDLDPSSIVPDSREEDVYVVPDAI